MKSMVLGGVILAGVVLGSLAIGSRPEAALAQRAAVHSSGGGNGLITLATPVGDHKQQLTVIDPELRVLSVYHIELSSGEVTLKSVRNIHWDLQIHEYNGTSPLPREIRAMLDQK